VPLARALVGVRACTGSNLAYAGCDCGAKAIMAEVPEAVVGIGTILTLRSGAQRRYRPRSASVRPPRSC